MVIAGHFEALGKAPGARAQRRLLRLEAEGHTAAGDATRGLIHNISAGGLLLECDLPLREGEAIDIALPHAGATAARVVWANGSFFGCRFDTAISDAALSAAQLRSEAPSAPGPLGEAFGPRLQRLRKERGLTMAQLAAQMGVSKPTVWAWEHGKAHPVDGRIEALAEALDVPVTAMLVDRTAQILPELLARARAQIGEALGVAPDKIRITVDL